MWVPILIILAIPVLAIAAPQAFCNPNLVQATDLAPLEFPVVIKADDGAMTYCPTAHDVFNHFEPQDLMAEGFFGWDSLGRRFYCHRESGTLVIEETARWRDFDSYYSEAYQVSAEIRPWRKSLLQEKDLSARNPL